MMQCQRLLQMHKNLRAQGMEIIGIDSHNLDVHIF